MEEKGDDLPALLPLSHCSPAEEEAAAVLLAEFGVSGPYDDLLHFAAPSTCVFAHGGRDVFLTGTAHDGDDDSEVIPTCKFIGGVDHTWPLECVVLHHTNILSSTTAEPLWDGVNAVLNGTDGSPTSVVLRDVLLPGTVGPVPVNSSRVFETVPDDGSDAHLLGTIDELLHEADVLLTMRRPFVDPMSEASILERQRAMAGEERCWTPISDIGKDDDDDTASITNAELMERLRSAEKERETWPTLFAYEFGPTLEEQQILSEWDAAVIRCEEQVDVSTRDVLLHMDEIIAEPETIEVAKETNQLKAEEDEAVVYSQPPPWEEKQTVVLESIATMETRDSELETVACERLQQAREERRRPRPVPPGQLVLDNFMTRIDAIAPPIAVEVQIRARVSEKIDGATEMQTCNSGEPNYKEQTTSVGIEIDKCESCSLEQIQKTAQRECFLVHREAYEARRMQEEEDRMLCEMQWREEETRRVEDALQKCLVEEEEDSQSIIAKELSSFQELCGEKEKHMLVVKENERLRKLHDVTHLANGLIKEHARIRCEIIALEETVVTNIIQEEEQERDVLHRKRDQNVAFIVRSVEQWVSAVRDRDLYSQIEPVKVQESAVSTLTAVWRLRTTSRWPPAITGAALRLRALRDERRVGGEWRRAGGRAVENATVALADAVRPLTPPASEGRPLSPISASNSNVNSTSSSDSTGVRLDAARAKQLQPITLGAVNTDQKYLAQLCHSLSFSLEQIAELDLASLGTLTLSGTRVASLVRELDLGGNVLRTLPLNGLMRVFPALQFLVASDNGLCNLTWRSAAAAAPRGVVEAHAHAIARASRVTHLDLSLNALQNIEAVGKLLSYHLRTLVIYANRIESLLPLESCMRLESLEASRNCVSSVAELEKLCLLQTVDLSENRITNLEPLAYSVLLQNLCLSRNQIQSLPKTLYLGFLRQLFISENRLEVISSDSFLWLPLLSVLHVENNKLWDISGVAHCPRLTTLSVAFNQIQRVEDLLPLTACKKLQSLSVIENPFVYNSENDSRHIALELKQKLLRWFPQLSELNNEKIGKGEREKSFWTETEDLRFLRMSRRLQKQEQENVIDDFEFWSYPLVNDINDDDDVRQMCGEFDSYFLYKNPIHAYADMFAALTSDVALTRIQKDQDVVTTVRRRRYHDALHIDEELRQRLGKSKQHLNPIVHRLSDKVKERNRRDAMLSIQGDLKSLQAATLVRSNVFTRSTLYHEKARAHRESRAKLLICEWVQRWILVKRAKKELKTLKLSREEEQRRRYEIAARIIQPIWRGAALRSRLKRILHSDDGDDDQFTHVSLDFLDASEGAPGGINGGGGVEAVLHSVLQAHASPPNFQLTPNSRPAGGFGGVINSVSVLDGLLSQRASSATGVRPTHTALHEKPRPESQPQGVQVPSLLPPSAPSQSSAQVDGEWGALVSSQLRKKQRKMARARRENMEREFMEDPLKAKRTMGKR